MRVGHVGQHNYKRNNSGGPGNTAPEINNPGPGLTVLQPLVS
jgi:hypothetical protein